MERRRIKSLNWLRVFEVAAQLESFSSAARVLNMSPSAVSQQVLALEAQLKTRLFERKPRHVELTKEGHAFLPTVKQALASIDRMADEIFEADGRSRVCLQANSIFASSWLAPRIAAFETQHPDIELSIICADRAVDFRDPEADLRISFGPVSDYGEVVRLFSETVFPVASPELVETVSAVEAYPQHSLIEVLSHPLGWEEYLLHNEVQVTAPLKVFKASNTLLALTLAAAGHGIALARQPATNWLIRQLGLSPFSVGSELQGEEYYYLSTHAERPLSTAANAFKAWLLKEARAQSHSNQHFFD